MKDYRKTAPLALIAITVIACLGRVYMLEEKENQYDAYLNSARQYREGKIYVDAIAQYRKALDMKNSVALCKEIGATYLEENKDEHIQKWGDYMMDTYPKDVAGYEYAVKYDIFKENYTDCFATYDVAQKRGLESKGLSEAINSVLYAYELGYSNYDEVGDYSNEYTWVSDGGLYGYTDLTGEEKIACSYKKAGSFNHDLAPVENAQGEYFFIDKEGNRKLNVPKNMSVTTLGYYEDDLYPVGTEGKMYFADVKGNLVLGPYEDVSAFANYRAAIKEKGAWYLIDTTGKKMSKGYQGFAVDTKRIVFRNNIAFARTNDGYIMINGEGAQVGNKVYEDARCFLDATYAAVKKDGVWGYVDQTGKEIIKPQFQDAKSFSHEMAAVEKDNLWGYIDTAGNLTIQPTFADAGSMNEQGISYVKDVETGVWVTMKLYKNNF